MKKFNNIESWASSVGYIVEKVSDGYVWYPSDQQEYKNCATISDVIEDILSEVRLSYIEGEE